MFKPLVLANALALTTILFYVLFWILQIFAPTFFKLFLNSQFMGADLASLVPKPSLANFLGILIAAGLLTWVFGYFLARIYNSLARQ